MKRIREDQAGGAPAAVVEADSGKPAECRRCGWWVVDGMCSRRADTGDACELYAFGSTSWEAPDPAARLVVKDPKVQRYLDHGHALEWSQWYVRLCERYVKGLSRREEYAWFVQSSTGPAATKIVNKYSPKRRTA